ncbi:hypothetical protein EVAR_73469_1 [Eumeta japonica]|uniref:Uncharacterized protein n=1 Tax=Eumeta variegata TaxID=151549 RepID=A0A4C1T4F0_EUMVA|nr:hypothetical protein EVAR_73469_1 [Eumeta japonica]
MAEGGNHRIVVNVKTPKEKKVIEVDEDSGIKDRAPADVRQTPFGLNTMGGLSGLEALGAGSGTFMDLQARMQNELLNNGDMLRTLLDNPWFNK